MGLLVNIRYVKFKVSKYNLKKFTTKKKYVVYTTFIMKTIFCGKQVLIKINTEKLLLTNTIF